MMFDWDLWPYRVAAGDGELAWLKYRMERDVRALQAAIGLALYPAIRPLARMEGDFGRITAALAKSVPWTGDFGGLRR